jgi:AhpD family alkylhydroperoxidase
MEMKTGNRLYSLPEVYGILYRGIKNMKYMRKAKKKNELSPELKERIMLAVTEVNGCGICSYAHAKIALEAGLDSREIQDMLAGITDEVPAEELPAILFAQHYAESRGRPSQEVLERVTEIYGLSKTQGILGAIGGIMVGNAYGIPWSAFWNRLRGKPDRRSSLRYEVGMMTVGTVMAPIALVHALLSDLLGAA